jgi:hypothetical protein
MPTGGQTDPNSILKKKKESDKNKSKFNKAHPTVILFI